MGRRLGARQRLEDTLDHLRYRIDRFSDPSYHHLPSLGEDATVAARAEGTASRWEAMTPILDELDPRSALDVGCNSGWFVCALAGRGIPTVGVEREPRLYRTAMYAARKSEASGIIGILAMHVSEESVELIPQAECVVFLSAWHHLVREEGLDAAGRILEVIWNRTGRVLFFDTGEDEMPASFGLPAMTPDARTWLAAYLELTCHGGSVQHLGLHQGGWNGTHKVYRNLFAVRR